MRRLIDRPWFALVELGLVALSWGVWITKPEWGIWFFVVALVPFGLRISTGKFQYNPIDLLVLLFVVTAWTGYWAAYDPITAWGKAWLIVTAALSYFSLKAQPKENLTRVSYFLFSVGIGASVYHLLSHDFSAAPSQLEVVNQIGRWIMEVRPQTGWAAIHPNYVAGTIAITVPFAVYSSREIRNSKHSLKPLVTAIMVTGLGLAGFTFVMTSSGGILLAVASGVGAWVLWRFTNLSWIRRHFSGKRFFPILLSLYLCGVVAFIFLGPAHRGSVYSGIHSYGTGSRAELFQRSLQLLPDFPFTGGGLSSFPGSYSQYILNIPYFYYPNSHNLFLDVAIEQGILGGAAFLLIYLMGVWTVSGSIPREKEGQVFQWIVLFCLVVAVVHGMVYDYLYNGIGTALSLFLIGLALNGHRFEMAVRERRIILQVAVIAAVIGMLLGVLSFNQIRGLWLTNIGAVQMAKVELAEFPNAGWAGSEILPQLEAADTTLHGSLQYLPDNRTANHRIGLIDMYRRNFESAAGHLEKAYAQDPDHRGIIKTLGFCYVWLGEKDKAKGLLVQIPEAVEELNVYAWWWETQGRSDLSAAANSTLEILHTSIPQP